MSHGAKRFPMRRFGMSLRGSLIAPSAVRDAKTKRTLRWFHQTIAAAKLVAEGRYTSPEPRDKLALRLRQFVALFDRERAWDAAGDLGEPLRRRALEVADVLERQGLRAH